MQVNGEGSLQSKIWLIGEAPGENEERTGRPFTGGAGRVLDGLLSETGIRRNETYVDNVIQERPPKNDFSIYYEDKSGRVPSQALLRGHARIQGLVKEHKPNIVVALGNEALFALTGKKQITKWRGSILSCGGVKVIPMIHPAMVMRQYEFKPACVLDLTRVKKESTSPAFPLPYKDNFIINPSFIQVMEYLKDVLPTKKYLTFDIETAQNQIECIGFGWSKEDAICIPIFYGVNSWWSAEEELSIVKELRNLFANPSINFIAQNAQFDMIFIADKWNVDLNKLNLWMDTMVGFHCVYPELRKGLDFIGSVYTNRPYWKDSGEGGPHNLFHYNCIDTVATYESAMEIRKELDEFGTLPFYQENSHKLIKPLIKMQRRGIKVDIDKRQAIDKNLSGNETEMVKRLSLVVGHELNPNSPKQMKEFLYTELHLPEKINRKTGNISADEDTLEELNKDFPSPVFNLILDIRKVRKLLSTYIRASLDSDGRMRCSYVITGTETGRLSSRESIYGSGTNLQNIPRGDIVRSMFIPDNGKVFINADLSQAEARVVAYLAEEERMQNVFSDPKGDIHKRNAAMVFNKPIKDVTESERQLAKTLVHAANYGIGARTFSKHIGRSEAEARGLLNQYYAIYPGIKLWHMEVESQLRKSRILRTPMGRARMFFNRWGDELVKEGIAYVPQSTVSDILNLGIINADRAMPQGWEIILQQHDAVLMQVPITTDHLHIQRFITHYFEIPVHIKGKMFKIPVDIKIGDNWARLKKMEV